MAIHLTQIGKYGFACGLFWQSLSRPRELQREARELGQKIDCDVAVVRKEYATAQAGFGQSGELPRTAVHALAAAVAHQVAQKGAAYDADSQGLHNWLGAFALPDGNWAYFAVRDANLLPNGDFAGSREEVFERLHGDYGLGGWNLVIGDPELEDYGFHHFVAASLEQLLAGKNGQVAVQRAWQLRPLRRTLPSRRMTAGLAAALVAALGGAMAWQQLAAQREQERQEAALQRARLQIAERRSGPADHPWAQQPAVPALLEACAARLGYQGAGGWRLDRYDCTAQAVRYGWTREDSNPELLLAQVPAAHLEPGGERASYALPLALARSGDDALAERGRVLPHFLTGLQALHVKAQVTDQAVLPARPGAPAAAPAPAPAWQSYRYVLKGPDMPLTALLPVLHRPGIRVTRLAMQAGEWTIEGVIYVK